MKPLSSFPRRTYVTQPTPLQPAPRLSRLLGGPEIYIKRDDLLPGAGGGNKTRKLEFSIGDALARGEDTLITSGAIQSNHCRLTLSWARVEGLECHLVLQEPAPGAFDPEAGGNNFLYQLLGADSLRIVSGRGEAPLAMERLAGECRDRGRKPCVIPVGGSSPVGATGYAACALELISQFRELDLRVDHLVVPSGSAGTQAGLLAGFRGAGYELAVTGVNVSRSRDLQEPSVYELALATASRLGVESPVPRESVDCNGDYVGPGYALPTPEMMEAVGLVARSEGILLDPVYTGKAMAGTIDLIRKGVFRKGQTLVFVHTGGSPALYVHMEAFRRRYPPPPATDSAGNER